MTRKFSSTSVETTLASGISNTATSMTVATGTGSALLGGVTLGAGNVDQFTVALDPDTQNEEIVFITAVSSDTFTIVRGRAGTSGITHSGGATIKHVLTSDDLNAFETAVSPVSSITFSGSTSGTLSLQAASTASGTVTIPAGTGTLVSTTATQALTNKDLTSGTNTFPSTFVTTTATQTLTNKDLTSATNTFPTTLVTTTATQTLTNKTLTAPTVDDPKLNLLVNAQTGTTYTFVLADNGKFITASNSSAQTYSIPTNATTAFPVGTQIHIIQIGSAQVTIQAADSGTTTVLSTGATAAAPKTGKQYAAATCIKTATDTWYVIGDIA